MEEDIYFAGTCPLCKSKHMEFIIEKSAFKSHGYFKCNKCGCSSRPKKIPITAVKNESKARKDFISGSILHWQALSHFFNTRWKIPKKILVKYRDEIFQEHLMTCPLCRSTAIAIINNFETSSEYIICKECGFHTKEFPISSEKTEMVNNWNGK